MSGKRSRLGISSVQGAPTGVCPPRNDRRLASVGWTVNWDDALSVGPFPNGPYARPTFVSNTVSS
jgi:hypothetical protein